MARLWGYLVICLVSWDFVQSAAHLNEAIHAITSSRHNILVHSDDARHKLCSNENSNKTLIFWKNRNSWVDACTSAKKTGYLPRLWRIQFTYNYRMLFLPELPITFAIVIKH